MSVAGRAGRFESLTLGLAGTNPRFPWKPSTPMLTYRLASTTEYSGSTTTNPISIRHDHREPQPSRRIFAHHGAPRNAGAALLTWQWVHVAHAHLDLSPTWRGRKPTAQDRARYRTFEASLDDKQQLELALALHKRA